MKKQKGSLTVEAAIVLPIFICAILTIGFLTRIVYTHEIIQHGITESANEMASLSYLYYISGVHDIDDTLNSELEEKKKKTQEHINNIFDCYEELKNCVWQVKDITKDIYGDVIKDVASDPKGEIISLLSLMAKEGLDKGKTEIGNMMIRKYIKKYGLTDEKLKSLHIEKLDFSQSSYFNNNQDIDVIVKYKVNIPLPIKLISYIPITQRATVRAWMAGDDSAALVNLDDEDNESQKKDKRVYVSVKGSSYHRFGCYHIFKEIEALDLKDAKKLGLDPCTKCKPPVESKGKYRVYKSNKSCDGKYHKEGCTYLFKDIIEMELEEAVKKYKPCKICKPPCS
ncbi:TadE family protein [Paramaledivibacter caminithermalis]|jgi:hypothetical protein|nr:TadE family protein [Paramaledivibacter caminithermalis]